MVNVAPRLAKAAAAALPMPSVAPGDQNRLAFEIVCRQMLREHPYGVTGAKSYGPSIWISNRHWSDRHSSPCGAFPG